MSHIAAVMICLAFFVGCSPQQDPSGVEPGKDADVEDGGGEGNADRDRAEAYFVALGRVQSAEDEEKLLAEFGEWLTENDYKIRAEEKNGKYVLACPYFPPVTPWTEYTFFDLENLKLLPRL